MFGEEKLLIGTPSSYMYIYGNPPCKYLKKKMGDVWDPPPLIYMLWIAMKLKGDKWADHFY